MGKFIDLMGQRFGRLVVTSRMPNRNGNAVWLCKCDCGNDTIVLGSQLRGGKTISCGCWMRESSSIRRASDLAGKRFNMLYVRKFSHQDKSKNFVWECECDCGNIVYATSYALKSGHTKSCGCLQKRLAGERNLKNLIGQRFTRLFVKERYGSTKNGQALWLCECDCGNTKISTTVSLLRGRTKSCGCLKSEGEQIIQTWLENHQVDFKKEYRFEDCRYIEPLPFDFYIESRNTCIEFDGSQHFQESRLYTSKLSLDERQRNDAIKTEYCKQKGICLIRIPYWEKDNIEAILSDWLFLNDAEEANSSSVDLSA
jgi:very-short-patch-repair endonuclease